MIWYIDNMAMCAHIGMALTDTSETFATPEDVVEASERSNDSVDHTDIYIQR
jgi:hypothetical protein